jgi:CHAT domain-containing protein
MSLHAAGICEGNSRECASDYFVSSYTPTLSALLRAQQHARNLGKKDITLTLIGAQAAQDADLPTLMSIEEEMRNVAAVAEQSRIPVDSSSMQNEATIDRVAKSLERARFAHIACHGIQDASDTLSSGFCLADGNLTVSRLMDLDLKDAFFAFLSACETAKGDEKQPEQTVHVAAAMLFVGFKSVVATMWSATSGHGEWTID